MLCCNVVVADNQDYYRRRGDLPGSKDFDYEDRDLELNSVFNEEPMQRTGHKDDVFTVICVTRLKLPIGAS